MSLPFSNSCRVSVIVAVRAAAIACVVFGLAACGSAPVKPANDDRTPVSEQAPAGSSKSAAPGAGNDAESAGDATRGGKRNAAPLNTAGANQSGAAPNSAQAEVPKRAAADFDRAVGLMKAGRATDAELEFKQLSAAYPQLVAPRINLALLQRKAGRVDEAEATLKSAVEAVPASALLWNELGVTQRMRGEFKDAADSYEHAITADANFAPAHRNLGIVLDLYIGDAERALTELERYKELTGEEKPVNGWIAELRQRTGKPPAGRPKPATPPADNAPDAEGGAPAQPADAQPQAAPAATPPPKAGGT